MSVPGLDGYWQMIIDVTFCDRRRINYSVLRLFTGLTSAAFKAWYPTVNSAMHPESSPANKKTHQAILIR